MATPIASDKFKITGHGGLMENAKVNIGELYLRQIFGGEGMNQLDVILPEEKLGRRTIVANWGIYDSKDTHANLVAHGHGMQSFGAKWNNTFTLEFELERFKGSTLQVMGVHANNEANEWAIIGGTGEFALARGIIKRRGLGYDEKINSQTQELTMEFLCRMTKEVIVPPSQEIPDDAPSKIRPPKTPARTKLGPWGGNGGTLKDMEGKSRRLESLTIYHHGVVEGFQFSYKDEDEESHTTGIWGQNRNLWKIEIKFGRSEYVKQIIGAGSKTNPSYLCQLKIVTNVTTYGPYGFWEGIPFSSTVPENETVVGFFGSNDTNFITTIGVYTISK